MCRRNQISNKTKSKTSILSSSTFYYDDEEKSNMTEVLKPEDFATTDPYDKLYPAIENSRNSYDNLSPILTSSNTLPGNEVAGVEDAVGEEEVRLQSTYDKLSPIPQDSERAEVEISDDKAVVTSSSADIVLNKREESLTNSSTSRSSFTEDLLYHFERRLSDLGPRSKYPCLQKLERSVTSGAFDGKARDRGQGPKKKERNSSAVGRKKIVRAGGKRWKRQGGHFENGDHGKGMRKTVEEGAGINENSKSSKRTVFTPDMSAYDTLEPLGCANSNFQGYDSLSSMNKVATASFN